MLSRTFVRGLPAPTFFHRDGLLRNVDLAALARRAAARAPRRCRARDRRHVVDAGRAMLAALGRETDAIALAYPEGVAWHDARPRRRHRAVHDAARTGAARSIRTSA